MPDGVQDRDSGAGGTAGFPSGLYESALSQLFPGSGIRIRKCDLSVFLYVILFLIYAVEIVVVRFLLPVINVYIMVQVLGNLTGEDFLSEFAGLLQKIVSWILRTLLAGIIGINVVQGLLAPAVDTLRRSALTRTAEALPWVGNAVGGAAEVVLGTAVLIKNGIGMAER